MGDLLEVNFGGRKAIVPDLTEVGGDLRLLGEELRDIGVELSKVWLILNHLSSFARSHRLISEHRDRMKVQDLEQLENIAEKSGPTEWNLHPNYYLALVDEIRARQASGK